MGIQLGLGWAVTEQSHILPQERRENAVGEEAWGRDSVGLHPKETVNPFFPPHPNRARTPGRLV